MADLVLGVAGAAVGGMIGGPMGAKVGYMLGSAIGSSMGPTTHNDGPRLGDLRVTSSSQGDAIPRSYGTNRIAGKLIWALDLEEVATTQSRGGKGGPKVEATTYTYYGTAAYAICEGPIIGIKKIWINNEVVYDNSAVLSSTDIYNMNAAELQAITTNQLQSTSNIGQYMRIYYGSETQTPDSRMEAEIGAGVTPALRGTAYVVFERLPLQRYGNRLPNIEFEVVATSPTYIQTALAVSFPRQTFNTFVQPQQANLTYYEGEIWSVNAVDNTAYSTSYTAEFTVHRYSPGDSTPMDMGRMGGSQNPSLGLYTTNPLRLRSNSPAGAQYEFYTGAGNQKARIIHFLDALSGNSTALICPTGADIGVYNGALAHHSGSFVLSTAHFGSTIPSGNRIWYWDTTASYVAIDLSSTIDVIDVGLDAQYIYALCQQGTNTVVVRKISRSTLAVVSTSGEILCDGPEQTASMYIGTGGTVYLQAQRMYVGSLGNDTSLALAKWTGSGSWTILARYPVKVQFTSELGWASINRDFLWANGEKAIASSNNNIQPLTGAVLISLRALTGAATTVGAVVSDLCAYAGLTDIDTTDLTDSIIGYTIGSRSTVRGALEPLRNYSFFDGAEINGQVIFKKRGSATVETISDDEIVSDGVELTRIQDMDLPKEVCIHYPDYDFGYQTGAQYARRMATSSNQVNDTGLAIVMTATTAQKVAQATLYEAYASRTSASFSTSLKYAHIEPMDVVQVGGNRIRITSKEDNIGELKFAGVLDDSAAVVQVVNTISNGYGNQTIAFLGSSDLVIYDGQSLRDSDAGSAYGFVTGNGSAWSGAAIFDSTNKVDYTQKASIFSTAVVGRLTTSLGLPIKNALIDEKSIIDVTMNVPATLASVSYEQMLSGANVALIGNEFVSFRNAILVGGSNTQPVYRISGLMRGLRGTDVAASSVGTRFILVSSGGVIALDFAASDIGKKHYMKAISFGKSDGAVREFTASDLGLKPNAPAQLNAGKNSAGTYVLQWVRSTRTDMAWRDNGGGALDETVEKYEVEAIKNGVTTLFTTSTPSVTLTGMTGPFTVNVYQISDKVGRGRAASISLT